MSQIQTTWMKVKEEIVNEPQWLKEGEKIEIEYGQWKEIQTQRKNRKTGEAYQSRDFQLHAKDTKGQTAERLVNKFLFVAILDAFEKEYPLTKGQKLEDYEKTLQTKTIIYRRPISA